MRTRLLVAILLLVTGTMVLAGTAGVLLIRQATISTARAQLASQVEAIGGVRRPLVIYGQLRRDQATGYRSLSLSGVDAAGRFVGDLPTALAGIHVDGSPLVRDAPVVGSSDRLVYALVPLHVTPRQLELARRRAPRLSEVVLVATRVVDTPTDGVPWFVALAGAVLAVAAVVAYWLANRFSRPLVTAARATQRIAGGDLGARMPTGRRDMPEFASLAAAINAMGDSIERARNQQRQFLLSVSHDLRTPLTSIRGYADAIADGTAGDVPAAVAVIDAEARRLERLVQDLLDLARLDARRFSLHPVTLDLNDVVRATVESWRPGAAATSVRLSMAVPAEAAPVVADRDRLAQLLSNLIENAFRYARTRVTVGTRSERGAVLLRVDDDGPGIEAADLGRVFEPHFSSDRADRRRSGTGLGLAIVAELAAAMGGGVRAQSPTGPDGGTVLEVWLPEAGAGERPDAEPAPVPPPG